MGGVKVLIVFLYSENLRIMQEVVNVIYGIVLELDEYKNVVVMDYG